MFADDTVVIAQTEKDLSQSVGKYHDVKRHCLTLNWEKVNAIVFSREHTECKVEVGESTD